MYQSYQQNAFQNQLGSANVNSQYRGLDNRYQPVGYVQSQYNQSVNPGFGSQYQNTNQFSNQFSNFQTQAPQSFHTASYRGNQPGHDVSQRADSTQPAQNQFGTGFGNHTSSFNSIGSSFGSQQFTQQQNPEAFHTASYHGNQPGHDAYQRGDSTQTAQSQYGIGAQGFNSFNTGVNTNQFGSSQSQGFNQFQNPQSFHTASYRGNQQGHDAYQRGDSTQPAQSQFGSVNTSFNRSQF